MADIAPLDDSGPELGIDWTGWRTMCRLAFYSLQLVLVTVLAAFIPLVLTDPLSVGVPLVQIVLIFVATPLAFYVLFYGWLIETRTMSYSGNSAEMLLSMSYVLRHGSGLDRMIYFLWAFIFYFVTVALVVAAAWMVDLESFNQPNGKGIAIIVLTGSLAGILTVQFALSYLLRMLKCANRRNSAPAPAGP